MGIFEYLKRLIQELIDFNKTGVVERGNQKAVTGGAVYDYHNTTPLNPATNLYIEKSGNVVNVEAVGVKGSDLASVDGVIPIGYRPKRTIYVCVEVHSSIDYKYHHGYVYFYTNGGVDGYFMKADGSQVSIRDSSYTQSVYFNTTYIV